MNEPRVGLLWGLHWWEWPLLAGALALFFAQLLVAAPGKSAAFDEHYHLTAGYTYLRTGDFRLATTHPPLMGVIGALALLGRDDLALPLDHPAWQAGDRFLFADVFVWEANTDSVGMILTARYPIMAVGGLLVVALFLWARRWIGLAGAWVVIALAAVDPNLLGHARVVTTDLGLTCFLLLALWRLWVWLEDGGWRNGLGFGLCAGLAMGAKFTGLFIWPAALLIVVLYPSLGAKVIVPRLAGLVGAGLVALGVLWTIYRFDVGYLADGVLPLPLPAPFYWQQLYNTFFRIVDLQGARYDFFWGEASNGGWWYYFPVALAVKTPLPLLILALAGGVAAVRRWGWRRSAVLWVLPALFLLLGLSGVLTIGYRHILPIVPLLILLAGHAAPAMWPLRPASVRQLWSTGIVVVLLLWAMVGSLRLFPHQEAFFNELAGPWPNWSNLLVDSNLDWGQDLPALRDVMAERGIGEVNLAYFGKAVPEKYGVRYRPLYGYLRFVDGAEVRAYNPHTPEPGWYAVSATSLRLGLHQADTLDLYAAFRERRPDARAGYSIYLYHLVDPPGQPVTRTVVVGEPVYRLAPAALGGQPGGRVQVKWLQTPETTLYPLGVGYTPPADWHPVAADFSGVFTLLGYTLSEVAQPSQPFPVALHWRVGGGPMPQPAPTRGAALAAFVHLTVPGDPGQKIAQFDGWPTALRGLEPGDVIVHLVMLELAPESEGRYDLLVGLYSPQSGTRLLVTNQPGSPDFVRAGEVLVGER
jgi:4-amino-4-deoxy-L-arabinose transferase-like glycosyltransferase